MRQYFIWQDFVKANLVRKENRYNPVTQKFEQVEYINSNILYAVQSRLDKKGIRFSIPNSIGQGQKITREKYERAFSLIRESRRVFSGQPLDNTFLKCLGEVGPFGI